MGASLGQKVDKSWAEGGKTLKKVGKLCAKIRRSLQKWSQSEKNVDKSWIQGGKKLK